MRRVLAPHLHLLHCHLLSALLLSTSPFHLYLYPLFSIIDWLSLACPFSLSARCMLAPQLHLLHYCLLPAFPLIKRCIFSLTLTAWLSLAYSFFLSSAVSKRLPPSVQMFSEQARLHLNINSTTKLLIIKSYWYNYFLLTH